MDTKEPSKFAHKRRGGPYKPKMTNEERRAKYTKIARDRRDKARMKERNKILFVFIVVGGVILFKNVHGLRKKVEVVVIVVMDQ